MLPQHLKTITLRTMVVAVVLMASAVWVGSKGLHADWWVNPLLQYALAQIHNWFRLIFCNIKNCHKCRTKLKNLKRKLHLFRVMDTKPSSTDCSVGARSWAREASTVILRLVQSRTNYNSVKLCKKHFTSDKLCLWSTFILNTEWVQEALKNAKLILLQRNQNHYPKGEFDSLQLCFLTLIGSKRGLPWSELMIQFWAFRR